jgi:hypothetical protein
VIITSTPGPTEESQNVEKPDGVVRLRQDNDHEGVSVGVRQLQDLGLEGVDAGEPDGRGQVHALAAQRSFLQACKARF